MTPADAALRSALSPALLATAPHRLLFFVGATNVLLAMAWWAAWLVSARWPGVLPQHAPSAPAGWMHAIVMQYQVLPPFIFGFLLTVFPRWLGMPALARRHYAPVGIGLFGGQLLTLAGLWSGSTGWLALGLAVTLAGWSVALASSLGVLLRAAKGDWHARSCAFALCLGWIGLALVLAYLATDDARLMFAAIKFGTFGLLLPVFFTVNHRMVPFFVGCIYPDHASWRPFWLLGVFWGLVLAHLGLELVHGYAWSWLTDLPLAVLGVVFAWRWWPRGQAKPLPALLRVLLLGFCWLPVAMALYAAQSLWFATTGGWAYPRAPAHALLIGYFGSLLVAMVTRVTQGHAGRPLVLGRTATFAFAALQLTVLVRLAAEARADALAWQAAAAGLWLAAFLPWVLHSASIYLRPRADGKPG